MSTRAADSKWTMIAHLAVLLLLPMVVLGPALLTPGYVETFDMVWLPDLTMRPSALGLGTGWPRAVPSDAVIATLDNVFGGVVLQKTVLFGALASAAVGAAVLVGLQHRLPSTAAGLFYVWNPFVYERLVMGHWPILLGLGALPWVILAAREIRRGNPKAWGWWLLCLWLGSLSASAGLVTGTVSLACLLRWRGWRRNAGVLVALVAANAPWLVAGFRTEGLSTDLDGVAAFVAHGEGPLPLPLATLTLGGIWNEAVVPGSRSGALAWFSVFLVGFMVSALGHLYRHRPRWEFGVLVGAGALFWATSVIPAALPGGFALAVEHLPALALLRDSARYLGPLVLLQAVLFGHALIRLEPSFTRQSFARQSFVRRATIALLPIAVLPVALVPELFWGAQGRLEPVALPDSYRQVRATLDRELSDRGAAVLVLPFESYRAPEWNARRPVLDPMGRVVPNDSVINDQLVVSGRVIDGADPIAAEVAGLIAEDALSARSLTSLGIAAVVAEPAAFEQAGQLAGDRWLGSGDVLILGLPEVERARRVSRPDLGQTTSAGSVVGAVGAAGIGWVGYVLVLVGGVLRILLPVKTWNRSNS